MPEQFALVHSEITMKFIICSSNCQGLVMSICSLQYSFSTKVNSSESSVQIENGSSTQVIPSFDIQLSRAI